MTVIRPNSISGVTSITAHTQSIEFYKSDGSLSGANLDGVNINTAGILTAANFKTGTSNLHSTGLDLDNARIAGVATFYQGGSEVIRINSGGLLAYNDISFFGASTHAYWDHSANQFKLNDNTKISLGSGGDMQLYHDGNHTHLHDSGQGVVYLRTNMLQVNNAANNQAMAEFDTTSVDLYSGNSRKFQTTNTGVVVTGICTATSFSGSGANLTGLATSEDINNLINNVAMLGFKVAVNGSLARYNLVDQVIDEFNDASGIDAGASTNEILGGSGNAKYYSGSTSSSSNTTQTYAYTGSDVTLALNNGQTVSGTIKLWAAAGGTDYSPGNSNHRGGAGAFASAVFDYTSDGTDLIFSVGQGGISGTKAGSGGNGGGYSGVFLGSKTHGNALIVVGAGGGAGDTAGYNGAEGGAFGGNGSSGYTGGGGGQQGAGGAGGGNPFGGATVLPTAGSALTGGHGGGNQARSQAAAYNGGGIQGQEPGGYQGGGGGGAGYYGGGGGAGGNGGSGGGGGSSWYNTGSYWSGTPSSTAGNGGTSGGASDSNYPGGGVGSVTAGTRNNGGNGAIYVNINVGTIAYNNMTLQSVDATASSAPSTADLIMMIENSAGTATLNTDIKAYISRDSGANFTQGTLVDEGSWGTSTKRILAFHNLDISGQPSGTAVCYKITTHNQSASKSTRIHAVSHGWK